MYPLIPPGKVDPMDPEFSVCDSLRRLSDDHFVFFSKRFKGGLQEQCFADEVGLPCSRLIPSPQVPRRQVGGATEAPPDFPTTGTPGETRLFFGFGGLLLLAFGILLRLAGQAAGAFTPAYETTTSEQFAVVPEIGVRSDALAQSTKNLLQFGYAQVADDPAALLGVVACDYVIVGGNGFLVDRTDLGQRGKTEVHLGSQGFQSMYRQNCFFKNSCSIQIKHLLSRFFSTPEASLVRRGRRTKYNLVIM